MKVLVGLTACCESRMSRRTKAGMFSCNACGNAVRDQATVTWVDKWEWVAAQNNSEAEAWQAELAEAAAEVLAEARS